MSPGDRVASVADRYWTAVVLARPRSGNVLIRWATGPLAGREARVPVATVRTYATVAMAAEERTEIPTVPAPKTDK